MSVKRSPDRWIHNFSVSESRLHERGGFTIYRVTSVIFPVDQPEALSCVTTWRRYSEVKELHKQLSKKIKRDGLRLKLPALTQDRKLYFTRFDPAVIEGRRQFILQFLDYIGSKPSLYSCEIFTTFLNATGQNSPIPTDTDPVDGLCQPYPFPLAWDSEERSSNSLAEDQISITTTNSSQTGCSDRVPEDGHAAAALRPKFSSDYLVEAAERFNEAVQFEVNDRYSEALATYKDGIEILMAGIRADTDQSRRQLAKEKVQKYLSRSENIYEHFLKPNPVCEGEWNAGRRNTRELPLNQLAKYRVIRVLDYNIMSVQEVTTRRFYVIKSIDRTDDWKAPGSQDSIFTEHSSPYMVSLVAYFVTEFVIFLLLQPASGGKLLDYIAAYDPRLDGPVGIETEVVAGGEEEDAVAAAPAYETMTSDLEIEDLLLSSQMLLKSVQKTLDNYKEEDPTPTAHPLKTEKCYAKDARPQRIPEACVRQWAKELIVAVDALHNRNIVLGNLSTENLLLGKSGQLMLTYYHFRDFSRAVSKHNYHENGYFAPDRPLRPASDWFNVGVILYELLTGHRFIDYHPGAWCYFELQFPETVELSQVALSLLKGLIVESPEKRYGFASICAHPFFNEADWTALQRKGITS